MDFTLPSGSKMTVSEAAYVDARSLLNALLKCIEGVPLATDPTKMDVTVLKDALIKGMTNQDVDEAVFKCAERAVYENVKVSRALFDDPKLKDAARADLFVILWHIVEVNCGPFFGKTFSVLIERLRTSPFVHPLPSTSTTPS